MADLNLLVNSSSVHASLSLPIPNNPGLAGTTLFVQGLQVELLLPAGVLSIATSPKGTAVIWS